MKIHLIYISTIIIIIAVLFNCERTVVVNNDVPIYVTEYIQDTIHYNHIIDSLDSSVAILRTSNELLSKKHTNVSKQLKLSLEDTIKVKEYINTTDTLIIIKDSIIYEQASLIDTQYVYLGIKNDYITKVDSSLLKEQKKTSKQLKVNKRNKRIGVVGTFLGIILGAIVTN